MKYHSRLLFSFLAVAVGSPVQAVAAEDCAALDDPQARLACYDARFPRAEPEAPPPPDSPPAVSESPTVTSEPTTGPATAVVATPAPPTPPADPERPATTGETAAATPAKSGLFGDEKVDLTTTIKAVRAGEKQKMVFLLANDQVWMQATPRPLPFKNGDTVTIRNATLGGYFMRSEKGTSTRVQRLQ